MSHSTSPDPRARLASAALATLIPLCAMPPRALPMPPERPPLVTPETETAIQRGLAFLARTQNRDGGWRHQRQAGRYPVAMTALAGLAMLANGNTTTQGPYAPNVSRATSFILASVRPGGLICQPEERSRSMYGHGFSMLFLGQLLGMEEDPQRQRQIQHVLDDAVTLTGKSQSPLGGWYYTPESTTDEGSVTITQLQGLRSCRNAGVAVPKRIIDGALEYLDRSLNPDGGIAYRAGQKGPSRPPITAAAVACWFNAGLYDDERALRALAYCKQNIPVGGNAGRYLWGHYFYAHLYMSQIMWISGGENWQWYYPQIRDQLLGLQDREGAWEGDGVGRTYGTAIAVFILQLPYNQLPILQR
jgi:hypothetical protein